VGGCVCERSQRASSGCHIFHAIAVVTPSTHELVSLFGGGGIDIHTLQHYTSSNTLHFA
jgi:hypothetical protein